ncbi:hypothetical protein V493_01417 [Pseudogymnoascus sp. VKM F-4281 (FW-2241)]|nr:hypothetical protein V493_01417 [Pseudogymnoascus sp. VKM F-4281 (FW-2241)]
MTLFTRTYANYFIPRLLALEFNMSGKTTGSSFNLLYFASASSFTGKDSDEFEAPVSLSKLFDLVEARYPGIKSTILDSCLVTINLEYVDVPESETGEANITIKAGDEVAIIPPVSSG